MKDAILVLNAGSSSVKFSVFIAEDEALELKFRGQLEGLFTSPRFVAKDPNGKVVSEKSWGDGVKLGHEGALEHLRDYLLGLASEIQLIGVGHRVVHGGTKYARPVRLNQAVLADLEQLIRSRRCISRTTCDPSASSWSACRPCRKWPCLTPRFTALIHPWPRCSRCPKR
jgi:acetate kinase